MHLMLQRNSGILKSSSPHLNYGRMILLLKPNESRPCWRSFILHLFGVVFVRHFVRLSTEQTFKVQINSWCYYLPFSRHSQASFHVCTHENTTPCGLTCKTSGRLAITAVAVWTNNLLSFLLHTFDCAVNRSSFMQISGRFELFKATGGEQPKSLLARFSWDCEDSCHNSNFRREPTPAEPTHSTDPLTLMSIYSPLKWRAIH